MSPDVNEKFRAGVFELIFKFHFDPVPVPGYLESLVYCKDVRKVSLVNGVLLYNTGRGVHPGFVTQFSPVGNMIQVLQIGYGEGNWMMGPEAALDFIKRQLS